MKPRFYHPKYLYEVSRRTIGGTFLFDLNDQSLMTAITGVLGEAQRRYGVRIFHYHFMSNHYHGLFDAPSPLQLVRFLNFVHGRIATLVNLRLTRTGPVWSAKFRPVAVATDDKTLLHRMKYIMGQATRAGMVRHPRQFAGPSAVDWLVAGVPIHGRYRGTLPARAALEKAQGTSTSHESHHCSAALTDTQGEERTVNIALLPCFADQDWPTMHCTFAAMADDIAGISLAEVLAVDTTLKAAVVNQEQSCLAPEGQDDDRGDFESSDGQETDKSDRGALGDLLESITDIDTADIGSVKASAPDPIDPATLQPQTRKAPGSKHKSKEMLEILTFNQEVRKAYKVELQQFTEAYRIALTRLGKQVARALAGLRAHAVRFPDYAVLPSCLGAAAIAAVMASQARR